MSNYTLKRLSDEVNELFKGAGGKVNIPVSLNGRLTRALGRTWMPTLKIEFSTKFVENSSDNEVRDVLIHEVAHAVSFVRDGNRGHNNKFKDVVVELGADRSVGKCVYESVEGRSPFKYEVVCHDCGKSLAKYQRWAGRLKNIKDYHCEFCGCKNLDVFEY